MSFIMDKLDNINELLCKYNYAVPRYTSFPPATKFTQDISQSDYTALLKGLPSSNAVSLYVHIPFCHELCLYCGCNTKVLNSYSPVESYIKLLLSEITLVGESTNGKLPVNLLHFGGGSPNYLKPNDLKLIVAHISEFFDISKQTSIDIESDPRHLGGEMIKAFVDIGVTRISLGVQDFNHDVQIAINRVQPFEQVKACVKKLRDNGINKINFDLIIGLPNQTIETVTDTAHLAASLSPDRLAVFPYAHVPWMKKHQKLLEKYPMADGKERFLMNEAVDTVLKSHDYKAIGTDHYAKSSDSLAVAQNNGVLRRNFQGYTVDISEAIIGFGHSSISSFKSAYVQNTITPADYRNAINNGEFPVNRGVKLSENDQGLSRLIEELMCNFKVNLEGYKDYIGSDYSDKLATLIQDGLVIMDGMQLIITDKGKPFTRVVASCFDPYFEKQENQHAKAI